MKETKGNQVTKKKGTKKQKTQKAKRITIEKKKENSKEKRNKKGLLALGGGVFEMNFADFLRNINKHVSTYSEMELPDLNLTSKEVNEHENYMKIFYSKELSVFEETELKVICEKFAESFETVVVYLANNAGMDGIVEVGKIKEFIEKGERDIGIRFDMEGVGRIQKVESPFGVYSSIVRLVAEFVYQVLKTNDVLN